jgi:hypothetical protein
MYLMNRILIISLLFLGCSKLTKPVNDSSIPKPSENKKEENPVVEEKSPLGSSVVDDGLLIGPSAGDRIVFSGVVAGDYHPDKVKNWNPQSGPVITGTHQSQPDAGSTLRRKNNLYATELIRDANERVELLYHGVDYQFQTTTTDKIFSAVSSDFLQRSDPRDLNPTQWTKHGLAFNPGQTYAIGDPSVVVVNWDNTTDRVFMVFSAGFPVSSLSTNSHIGWAITTQVPRTSWQPHNSFRITPTADQLGLCNTTSYKWALYSFCRSDAPNQIDNKLRVQDGEGRELSAIHRPSLIYDKHSGAYHLYFDQAGITVDSGAGRANETSWMMSQTAGMTVDQANLEFNNNVTQRKQADCDLGPNDCQFSGGNVRYATGYDGKTFTLVTPAGKKSVARGVAPEAKKFKNGWILFSDLWPSQSSQVGPGKSLIECAQSQPDPPNPGCIRSLIGTFQSSDGINYTEIKPIYTFDEFLLPTNVTAITKDDSLRGILYGSFKKTDTNFACADSYRLNWGDVCIEQGRIRALFLQKKIVFQAENCLIDTALALDEDRLELTIDPAKCPGGVPNDGLAGDISIYDTDASTLLHKSAFTLKKGRLNSFKRN